MAFLHRLRYELSQMRSFGPFQQNWYIINSYSGSTVPWIQDYRLAWDKVQKIWYEAKRNLIQVSPRNRQITHGIRVKPSTKFVLRQQWDPGSKHMLVFIYYRFIPSLWRGDREIKKCTERRGWKILSGKGKVSVIGKNNYKGGLASSDSN